MKVKVFLTGMVLLLSIGAISAKEIETVVFKAEQMFCNNCENKVKNNLRFEKGVKKITTDLENKTVTVEFDPGQTTVESLIKGFEKINYQVTVFTGNDLTVSFEALQMRCGGCAGKVRRTLEAEPGVKSVETDVPTKEVKIAYDPALTTPEALKEAFLKLDYAVTDYYADAKVKYVLFKADQMNCGGCAGKVKKNISAEPGVKDVNVNLAIKAVSIAYDSEQIDPDGLLAAFRKFNYEVAEY